ncbi:Tn3 family transposase [Streptomyces iconiensis]|uniref:Tn3 family transposase n=1 Tax=Streptomyces iconiensis TaxID=1384038 RepID=A0ABT7A684_9ACTN|nr:Tn3 family transposase [Streptomyces iconiensis]MDJ1136852.1 Tn3 family transposase [Streptomyces iconiensis]
MRAAADHCAFGLRLASLRQGLCQFREHVNTLLVQEVLADPKWADKLTDADCRALSPLFWTHVNPYGWFELDMNSRLDLDLSIRAMVPGPRARSPRGEPSSASA